MTLRNVLCRYVVMLLVCCWLSIANEWKAQIVLGPDRLWTIELPYASKSRARSTARLALATCIGHNVFLARVPFFRMELWV